MPTATIVDKFRKLEEALDAELVERRDLIRTMLLALVAKKHHFQLGSPGIAKSYAIRKLVAHIEGLDDNDYFEILLTRFTDEGLVFGPIDLMALKEGRRRFIPEGYISVAKIVMQDEIFKCNAAMLNGELLLLNERKVRNDGRMHEVPLHSCFSASNELTEGEELDALLDRFHFRVKVKDVQEPGNFIRMLKLGRDPVEGAILSWDEVEKATHEATLVDVPDEVYDALQTIRQQLAADGIRPSPRRWRDCIDIIKAHAWLDGRDVAEVSDTISLENVLWTSEEEIPRVSRFLIEFANPLDKEVMELWDTVDGLASELQKLSDEPDADNGLVAKKGIELHGKIDRAQEDFKKLEAKVEKSGRRSTKLEELRERLVTVIERMLVELFTLEADASDAV